MKINVLMTGAGAPGGPGIIKCLMKDKRINLIAGDINEYASGRFIAKNFVKLPSAKDEDFTDKVIEICLENNINIIFPLVTLELFKFSQNLKLFEENGIKVLVSKYESLNIANDKSKLYQHLKKLNIATPYFKIANNLDEIKSAVELIGKNNEPVVIKPSVSNGSRGIRILDGTKDRFELLFNEKPNSLYSSLSEIENIIGKNEIPEMLVSEFLPGEELTIDTNVKNGKVNIFLIRKRDRMNGGISVAGKFIVDKSIEEYCKTIIHSLDLDGPIGLQVKKSKSGDFLLLEINPRIQGTSVAAMGLGINLPLLAIYNKLDLDYNVPVKYEGIGFVRYYEEVYYDI